MTHMTKRQRKGFTLAELLVVVAIIAVLVAIAIPIFTAQLEKARQSTDLANIRAAYAEVMTAAVSDDTTISNVEYTSQHYKNGYLDSNPNVIVRTSTKSVLYVVNVSLTSNSNSWSDAEDNIKDLFDVVYQREENYNYAAIVYYHTSGHASSDNGLYLIYTPIPVTAEITDGMFT